MRSLLMLEVCEFSCLFASLCACASFDLLGAAGSPRATAWFDALISKGEHVFFRQLKRLAQFL